MIISITTLDEYVGKFYCEVFMTDDDGGVSDAFFSDQTQIHVRGEYIKLLMLLSIL